jgi:hypothetical protein
MKFINFVIDLTGSGTDAEMKAINVFNDYSRNNGHWITAEKIDSPTKLTVIDNRTKSNFMISK